MLTIQTLRDNLREKDKNKRFLNWEDINFDDPQYLPFLQGIADYWNEQDVNPYWTPINGGRGFQVGEPPASGWWDHGYRCAKMEIEGQQLVQEFIKAYTYPKIQKDRIYF